MKDKPVKEKKAKNKSTGHRLDNLEHYLQGQTPFMVSYDPLKDYPAPPVIEPPVEEPPKVEIL